MARCPLGPVTRGRLGEAALGPDFPFFFFGGNEGTAFAPHASPPPRRGQERQLLPGLGARWRPRASSLEAGCALVAQKAWAGQSHEAFFRTPSMDHGIPENV